MGSIVPLSSLPHRKENKKVWADDSYGILFYINSPTASYSIFVYVRSYHHGRDMMFEIGEPLIAGFIFVGMVVILFMTFFIVMGIIPAVLIAEYAGWDANNVFYNLITFYIVIALIYVLGWMVLTV
jgi:hypothetical protein